MAPMRVRMPTPAAMIAASTSGLIDRTYYGCRSRHRSCVPQVPTAAPCQTRVGYPSTCVQRTADTRRARAAPARRVSETHADFRGYPLTTVGASRDTEAEAFIEGGAMSDPMTSL